MVIVPQIEHSLIAGAHLREALLRTRVIAETASTVSLITRRILRGRVAVNGLGKPIRTKRQVLLNNRSNHRRRILHTIPASIPVSIGGEVIDGVFVSRATRAANGEIS